MPEISVVVPVYKVEPWLRQCVDSVLAQSFTDFELILVDDGSPDACGAICDAYAARDGRIHVIHQENAGQGKARNVGMDQAAGKYLIFLDSDDYWLPSALETLYAEAERNQTQVLVFSAMPFAEETKLPKKYLSYQHTVQNGAVKSGPESLKISMDSNEYYSEAWLRFYLLAYLRSTGLRFDAWFIHEDAKITFLSQLFAERVECIGERLYRYRVRPGSSMRKKTFQGSAHGHRMALDGLMDAWESRPLSALAKEQLARYCAARFDKIYKLFARARKQKDRKAARAIQKELGPALKRARALPSLPGSYRLATYSLAIHYDVRRLHGRLRRLIRRRKRASVES